jgi:hypothetical protein
MQMLFAWVSVYLLALLRMTYPDYHLVLDPAIKFRYIATKWRAEEQAEARNTLKQVVRSNLIGLI